MGQAASSIEALKAGAQSSRHASKQEREQQQKQGVDVPLLPYASAQAEAQHSTAQGWSTCGPCQAWRSHAAAGAAVAKGHAQHQGPSRGTAGREDQGQQPGEPTGPAAAAAAAAAASAGSVDEAYPALGEAAVQRELAVALGHEKAKHMIRALEEVGAPMHTVACALCPAYPWADPNPPCLQPAELCVHGELQAAGSHSHKPPPPSSPRPWIPQESLHMLLFGSESLY